MADELRTIATTAAPAPAGHYSQAMGWQDLVFVSGQLGVRPDGQHGFDRPFEEQVQQTLANVLAILAEAGCDAGSVLKVTAYIVGVENWPQFNAAYAALFGPARPARTVVPVTALHHGYLVEIDAVAARRHG